MKIDNLICILEEIKKRTGCEYIWDIQDFSNQDNFIVQVCEGYNQYTKDSCVAKKIVDVKVILEIREKILKSFDLKYDRGRVNDKQ